MATETWILDGVKELNENEKFYLGDVKAGVLSSLFAITLIPLILSLLDAANMGNLVYDYNCFAAERIINDI